MRLIIDACITTTKQYTQHTLCIGNLE